MVGTSLGTKAENSRKVNFSKGNESGIVARIYPQETNAVTSRTSTHRWSMGQGIATRNYQTNAATWTVTVTTEVPIFGAQVSLENKVWPPS